MENKQIWLIFETDWKECETKIYAFSTKDNADSFFAKCVASHYTRKGSCSIAEALKTYKYSITDAYDVEMQTVVLDKYVI